MSSDVKDSFGRIVENQGVARRRPRFAPRKLGQARPRAGPDAISPYHISRYSESESTKPRLVLQPIAVKKIGDDRRPQERTMRVPVVVIAARMESVRLTTAAAYVPHRTRLAQLIVVVDVHLFDEDSVSFALHY